MQITEVRIKLMEDAGERLQAFCSITFDECFVIRDLKIIEGANGPFVAMPSRKLTGHCPQCGCKNHLRAAYCNQCSLRLNQDRAPKDDDGRAKLYADIAHPINSACREMIQECVTKEFYVELERAKLPGYVSRYDDFDLDEGPRPQAPRPAAFKPAATQRTLPNNNKTGTQTSSGQQSPGQTRPANRVQSAQPAARGPHKSPAANNHPPQSFVPLPYSSTKFAQQHATTFQQTEEKPIVRPPDAQSPPAATALPETAEHSTALPATVIHPAHPQLAGDNLKAKTSVPATANGRPPEGFGAGIF